MTQELDATGARCTPILCDNESAIKLTKTDEFRPRTKHIDIRYHHLRDKVEAGIINVQYVATHENAADSLTKAVTKQKDDSCATKMGLSNFEKMNTN